MKMMKVELVSAGSLLDLRVRGSAAGGEGVRSAPYAAYAVAWPLLLGGKELGVLGHLEGEGELERDEGTPRSACRAGIAQSYQVPAGPCRRLLCCARCGRATLVG